ncbi:unnamed protein product [Oppiella nova]|uniref:Acyl-CoA dehydrogenase n=1 Tax=Oppiella nova TaxID=334625 RepID=A0A7R9Q986_9ACAR|nr:unnamed protein product [Oppiella nova]CAG2155803.1 unnamed protein product [Oppiella nova]
MAKFAQNVTLPLNRTGDEEGAHYENGKVTTPAGFKEAFQQYAEGGWIGLGADEEWGGQAMPKMLTVLADEMLFATNPSFMLYPLLSVGAAEPNQDGTYNITGTKIFITGGDHDLADNIIHLVLAKTPDAPAGSRGISLFIVPKFLVNADGSLGERNTAGPGSIEHKMGIKASATCVMNFDAAKGFLALLNMHTKMQHNMRLIAYKAVVRQVLNLQTNLLTASLYMVMYVVCYSMHVPTMKLLVHLQSMLVNNSTLLNFQPILKL